MVGRAVLFGGSGFVGTHLGQALVSSGWEVVSADIVPPQRPVGGVQYETSDVRQPITITGGAELVVNLAAVHRTPGHEPDEYYGTNVAGALNVTRWATAQVVRHLVFTSSISVYGPSEEIKDDATPPSPEVAYGWSKLFAEEIHREWEQTAADNHLTVIRPAVVFGQGEVGNYTRLARALRTRRFAYPGRDDTIKGCGYVADLVRAIVFAYERQASGSPIPSFNFCFPDKLTIREICEAFHEVAGFPLPHSVPASPVKAARAMARRLPGPGSRLDARIGKLTTSTSIVPSVLLAEGFQWQYDLPRALKDWMQSSGGTFT